MDEVVASAEIVRRIGADAPIAPVPANYPGEVAERWRYTDGLPGEVGVISSVTQAFCRACTRARLSTDGRLFLCLFAGSGYDLRAPLRAGIDDGQMAELVAGIWSARADRYSELRGETSPHADRVEMSYIGG
jgi:cyclic pyranopterin phosphate synthase